MRTATLAASIAALLFAVPAIAQSEPTAPFNIPTKVGGWTLTPSNVGCSVDFKGPARLDHASGASEAMITVSPRSGGRYEIDILVERARMPRFGGRFMLMIGGTSIPLTGRTGYGAMGSAGRFTATLDPANATLFNTGGIFEIHATAGTTQGLFVTLGVPAASAALRALPLCRPGPNRKAVPIRSPDRMVEEGDLDPVRGASKAGLIEADLTYDTTGKAQSCTVRRSSGKKPVDAKICELLMQRASFLPGTDANGSPLAGAFTYRLNPKTGLSRTFVPRDDD